MRDDLAAGLDQYWVAVGVGGVFVGAAFVAADPVVAFAQPGVDEFVTEVARGGDEVRLRASPINSSRRSRISLLPGPVRRGGQGERARKIGSTAMNQTDLHPTD
jgi:hypothetical protein